MKRKLENYNYNRFVVGDVNFDLVSDTEHKMYITLAAGRHHYKIKFTPPLQKDTVAFLNITHNPSSRYDICINLTSRDAPCIDDDRLVEYETHTLVRKMDLFPFAYIAIENTQLNWDPSHENIHIYKPVFNLGIEYFDESQYKRLKYIAPDETSDICASLIPQSLPVYTKRSGHITSSGLPKLLGYFVPEYEKEPKWNMWKREKQTSFSLVRMRFGGLREDDIIIAYLNKYKNRVFEQTGYTTHEDNKDKWGASPDGIIYDKETKKRKTIEFKSSQSDCEFKGYFIPQVLWEMACCKTDEGELVKYYEEKKNDNSKVEKHCRITVLKEDKELLKDITNLVVKSKKLRNSVQFMKLVHSKPYVDMRARLDKMADTIAFDDIHIPEEKIQEKNRYVQKRCFNEIRQENTVFERIQSQQSVIKHLYEKNKSVEMKEMIEKQIQMYKDMLK